MVQPEVGAGPWARGRVQLGEVAVRPQEAGVCLSPDQIWVRPVDDVVTGPKARMWPEVSGSRLFGNPGRSDVVFPKTAPKPSWLTKNLTLAAPPRNGHWFGILELSSLKWHREDRGRLEGKGQHHEMSVSPAFAEQTGPELRLRREWVTPYLGLPGDIALEGRSHWKALLHTPSQTPGLWGSRK